MANQMARAFVIGSPIAHSLSPELHGFWLKQHGLSGSYEKILVLPEELPDFLANVKKNGFVGGNITIPHKEVAYHQLDDCDENSTLLEAVNTVWIENEKLYASNTDSYGFSANLDDFAPKWRNAKTALVLGAGGASRSIILALINAKFETIYIANRTISRADALADKMGQQCVSIGESEISDCLKQVELLINTTSLGMNNQDKPQLELSNLPHSAIVTDIVYNPLITQLLQDANELGLKTVDGIGMLLHQAVPGFEKWFGIMPKVTEELRQHMLDILREDIS